MSIAGLLLAAGAGRRLGGHPKARLILNGRSLLEHGISRLLPFVDEVAAAVEPSASDVEIDAFGEAFANKKVVFVRGGASRQDSLCRLLRATQTEWVLVHEVARPLTPEAAFSATIAAARLHGAAAVYHKHTARDSVGLAQNGMLKTCLPRSDLVILQTPHVYRRVELIQAHERAETEAWQEEGTAAVALRAGIAIHLVECPGENLKVTYPEDWERVVLLAS
jgi:2-C-methyl-D-erythritol 4-phosphate cytidylyltransferase